MPVRLDAEAGTEMKVASSEYAKSPSAHSARIRARRALRF
jgi:hypothetical protein